MALMIFKSNNRNPSDPLCVSSLAAVNQSMLPSELQGSCSVCLAPIASAVGSCCCNCFTFEQPAIQITSVGIPDCVSPSVIAAFNAAFASPFQAFAVGGIPTFRPCQSFNTLSNPSPNCLWFGNIATYSIGGLTVDYGVEIVIAVREDPTTGLYADQSMTVTIQFAVGVPMSGSPVAPCSYYNSYTVSDSGYGDLSGITLGGKQIYSLQNFASAGISGIPNGRFDCSGGVLQLVSSNMAYAGSTSSSGATHDGSTFTGPVSDAVTTAIASTLEVSSSECGSAIIPFPPGASSSSSSSSSGG